jgi:ATP-dependent clp protease, ATP-binding subunit clpA
MPAYINSYDTDLVLNGARNYSVLYRNEFVTPEHLLLALTGLENFALSLQTSGGNVARLNAELVDVVTKMETVPVDWNQLPNHSMQMELLLDNAHKLAMLAEVQVVQVPHLVMALLGLQDSNAAYLLGKQLGENTSSFVAELVSLYDSDDGVSGYGDTDAFNDDFDMDEEREELWRSLVTCVNETYKKHNPLIGRENELQRTIQVLCRKEKNNPLHVGEPGVGKTSLVYGLAAMIENGDVPERLKGCRIYQMDMGTMLAGTQYRGDLEKRIKQVMDGLLEEGNTILYIDEIHNLVGAGRASEGSMDASNMLKPYLESGDVRFIGSTTYAEYNRYFAKSAGIVRRFQQIDVPEPSPEEAVKILSGLKRQYEKFHNVTYAPEVIEFAVKASAKYINDRFLPDKAIDLIDEAGAYRQMHPLPTKRQKVDKELVADVLTKVCKVQAVALKDEGNEALLTLEKRMKQQIYGQDKAIELVTQAIQTAKAGLTEEGKPLAAMLFVGPTGVGKTEVARVLAAELGIELVRFDMSEYTEKHAVAKLIGSPAGYVGYEDGGLLTDAIRKSPNCVLLLDEIEKAHADIYNILLQVMDYARLTDNKGQKADFRNVVLIMTSNAGAQFASQANVGFASKISRGEAMMAQVKKTFKPEFINRLSSTVVFHDMDEPMGRLILKKKINALKQQLLARNVELTLDEKAENYLLKVGFTPLYGAREMDRVIAAKLKPLLTREILFGKLKKGGKAIVKTLTKEPPTPDDTNMQLVLDVPK